MVNLLRRLGYPWRYPAMILISFPRLIRTDTLELPQVAIVSGLLAGIAFPFSQIAAVVAAFPAIAIYIYFVYAFVSNEVRRFYWARSFDGRLTRRNALKTMRESPNRFALYVCVYAGGFDRACLSPAAVLVELDNGKQYAISPASRRIIDDCKNLGVELRDPNGNLLPNKVAG